MDEPGAEEAAGAAPAAAGIKLLISISSRIMLRGGLPFFVFRKFQ